MKERSIGEGEGRGKKGRRKGKTNINELNPDHEPGVRFFCTHRGSKVVPLNSWGRVSY